MEYNLTSPETIKRLLARHGTDFSKSLGQNFIIDDSICPTMADCCGADKQSGVIEIGTGVGVLTRELARVAKKVVAVELDTSLFPVLSETLDGLDNVFVRNEDFLETDLERLIAEEFPGMNVFVCANLPYYITSPIITKLIGCNKIKSATLMVQKEAADRICAEVGSRNSGVLTVSVSYRAKAQKIFDVRKTSFMPSPKVDSSVIKLDILEKPCVEVMDEDFFFKVVSAAFSQRRKTAVNSLSSGLGIDKNTVSAVLSAMSLSPTIRPECLTLQQLVDLSEALKENL